MLSHPVPTVVSLADRASAGRVREVDDELDERVGRLEDWLEETEGRLAAISECLRSLAAVLDAYAPARPTIDR